MHFNDIKIGNPRHENLVAKYDEIETAVTQAVDVASLESAVRQWDDARKQYDTWWSLVDLRFEQDTRNEKYKRDREFRNELHPKVQELDTTIKRLLLEPARREKLQGVFGEQALALWEADVLTYDPVIQDDLVRESKLDAQYTELLASAEIPFDGQKHNLSSITKYRQESNRQQRHDADGALWQWTAENGERFDGLFDELTRLRHQMAKKLGFENFIDLGYKRMNRVDYRQSDVEKFRAGVREHVVPLATEIRRQQAGRLGVEKLMFWDEAVHENRSNPKPAGDHDWMIQRAIEMFDAMGPLGPFFRLMNDGRFLDLKTRAGKGAGGFCTSFASYGMPFIFANFNGTKGDVEVFTHEMGHAFQNYESRNQPLFDYHWPTSESCEIHSMSLEFLTWPYMDKFFSAEQDDADRFRRIHLIEGLLFLPYGVAVDHYQHLIYAEPEALPERRHEMWREMEAMYLPWRDYGDLDYAAKGGRWQLQRHIFGSPFYYIDYTLAQTCALQFWLLAKKNRDDALDRYIALCRRGGSLPFQQLVHSAGLISPFDEGCLGEVVNMARAEIATT